jgi:phosphomevalonate kinase
MTAVLARAPGKLLLTGEYAVLYGAPALVAAVDREVEVGVAVNGVRGTLDVESRVEERCWRIANPEQEEITGGDLGAVLAALRVATAWAPDLAGRRMEVRVDARHFLVDGQKLGIGRSAATVTATVAALLAAVGHGERTETFEAAVAAHALFQEGRGSGADVAAAAHGGVIEFRRSAGRVAVRSRELPPGLRLLVGWTGEGAATDPLVRRFAASAGRREPRVLRDLCAAAEHAAGAAERGDAAALSAAVDASADLLARLGQELDLPIVTPALARLVAAARRVGAAAKPSGAGGGDCGIALARSAEEAAAVHAAWREAGIISLPLAISPGGVRPEAVAEVSGG